MNLDINKKIKELIEHGKTKEQVYLELLKRGALVNDIDKAYADELTTAIPKTKPDNIYNPEIDLGKLTASKLLLFLGGVITVIAGIIYIFLSWEGWTMLPRILAILIPIIILYSAGAFSWVSENYKKFSGFFIVPGALLFPLFLVITTNELNLFQGAIPGTQGFVISLLTLIFYLVSSLIFIQIFWALLTPLSGLFLYYFCLKMLGLDFYDDMLIYSWAFLLPGLIYILLGAYYFKNNLKERSIFPAVLGIITTLIAVVFLLFQSMDKEYLTWLVVLIGVGYFFLAALLESHEQEDIPTGVYFLSFATLFLTFLKLGLSGQLLFFLPRESELRIGGSITLVGIVYLLLSFGLSGIKAYKLERAQAFAPFFGAMGNLATLGGIFYMSTGGKKPLYETLTLLSSLASIFFSIPKQSRVFLYFGTLFLIIYIFDIGGEYFQNQIGWPITLFVAGILSMGIGIGMEVVRRRYFSSKD
jgi:hypothetical protein